MRIFDRRLFFRLMIAFIIVVIVGTLTHELGHYLLAKHFGYNAKLSYASVHYNSTLRIPFKHRFYVTIGGPMQTIVTGMIGLLLLFIYRRSFISTNKLSTGQWGMIFLSLFWLRQTVNLIMWLGIYFITGKFALRGDEIRIARYLQLPFWSIAAITGILGVMVLALVVFKFIPPKQRFTFLVSGLVGGVAGYILWIELLGKYIMP